MNRPILACVFFAFAAAAGAQDASQPNPYQGTSNPPADDAIITTTAPQPKPRAGHPANALEPAATQQPDSSQAPDSTQPPAAAQPQPQAMAANPPLPLATPANGDGTDEGIVQVAAPAPAPREPALAARPSTPDPDGDIVRPDPLPPGTLGEGTMIRVHLLDGLSSTSSEKGEPFRSQVATDVMQGGQVVIPAGSEIDGRVADVSTGHLGGHGSLMLRPETVTLADGTSYKLHADVAGTPGSSTRVGSEGSINPGSRVKRDSIEYGGAVGSGVVAGAILGGPAGALAGGLIGAGLVTTHLLVSHPQANLESGTVLILTLTEQMRLVPAGAPAN